MSKLQNDKFRTRQTKYAPQFGGSCAVAAATGHRVSASPKRWRIENGHLYLNKDPLAAILHKPLSKRIHRLAAELRGEQSTTTTTNTNINNNDAARGNAAIVESNAG